MLSEGTEACPLVDRPRALPVAGVREDANFLRIVADERMQGTQQEARCDAFAPPGPARRHFFDIGNAALELADYQPHRLITAPRHLPERRVVAGRLHKIIEELLVIRFALRRRAPETSPGVAQQRIDSAVVIWR